MRDNNDGRDESLIIGAVITCERRRNKPRLNYKICESGCDLLNGCENYRAWYKKSFNIDLPAEKKRKAVKNRFPTREEIQKREEQIAGTTEAYNILLQTIVIKPKAKKPRSKRKSVS